MLKGYMQMSKGKKKGGTTYELSFLRAALPLSCFLSSLNSRVSFSVNITKKKNKKLTQNLEWTNTMSKKLHRLVRTGHGRLEVYTES